MIKEIDAKSVEQLTSGQVVTSLQSAVKELVENAFDAEAKAVQIQLYNYGKDGFTVRDDGTGINERDIPSLAKQHSTSKLNAFTDLESVKTLGFRGEALASLCALANVEIVTNNGSSSFKRTFSLKPSTDKEYEKVVAPKGTSVHVENLFHSLPVRRKDFEKNAAKEYAKTVSQVQEMALFHNVKLNFDHYLKNKCVKVLQCQGTSLLQRIGCIYGSKRARSLQEISFDLNPNSETKISGCITKTGVVGDLAPVCQLIAVNGRPVKLGSVQRAIVDVYKQQTLNEQPFFVLNLQIDPSNYDVNVSPDKRTILLHHEPELVQELRNQMLNLFSAETQVLEIKAPQATQKTLFDAYKGIGQVINQSNPSTIKQTNKPNQLNSSNSSNSSNQSKLTRTGNQNGSGNSTVLDLPDIVQEEGDSIDSEEGNEGQNTGNDEAGNMEGAREGEKEFIAIKKELEETLVQTTALEENIHLPTTAIKENKENKENSRLSKTVNTHIHLPIDLQSIKLESKGTKLQTLQQTEIDDKNCEQILNLRISKTDFSSMQVIGQFNLGFILVRNGNDVFVLDQHACDEIYNFERLQKQTVLSRQPLINPVKLELSAIEELLVQDHLQVFINNGFSINIDQTAAPGSQCSLVTVPYSKNTIFDESDVYELISRIRSNPANSSLRCSRLRAMFAMRACRSSIMIGTPLSKLEMEKVVRNLGSLDRPWNCPHGRPTLRHITSLH